MAQCIPLFWFLDVNGSNDKTIKETQCMYEMKLCSSLWIFDIVYHWHLSPSYFQLKRQKFFFHKTWTKPGWRVILQKEPRFKKEMVVVEDVFIKTTIDLCGLNSLMGLPPPPTTTSSIGTIELLNKDNLLTCAKF